jgi:3-deoxy-manno-octulosonate cytidylyltransferase (CMP-KDO synthetase)
MASQTKISTRETLTAQLEGLRTSGHKVVFTNGCFDILHVGHIELLEMARGAGDFLVVGVNSDASVRRLKGESRPIHPQEARAKVLAALGCVDAVVIFDEDTPIETIRVLKPGVHVKGGDYLAEDLPETPVVRENGGEVLIVPLVAGFSTTRALESSNQASNETSNESTEANRSTPAVIIIPARYGSTRFPGKPLVELVGQTVISRVVRAALRTAAQKPVLVATDDTRIAAEIENHFTQDEALAVMTSPDCHTGTDRLSEALRAHFGTIEERLIVVNVQGDEPFIEPAHIDVLIEMMRGDESLQMATLVTPIWEVEHEKDPNIVKAVVSERKRALYFSRAPIPYDRDAGGAQRFRHLGIYAYDARWLVKMATLPPSKLEEIEKLEQLRALENGVEIGVAIIDGVVPIAIDTPEDLVRAQAFLGFDSAS